MRNAILATVAAIAPLLVAPSIAHAEFATPRPKLELRPVTNRVVAMPVAPVPVIPHLSVDEVLGKINTVYMAGLQRCYRKSLVSDPSISGKVTLDIRVNAEGRAVGALATDDATMDHCMSRVVTGWQFTAPANDKEASYKISLVLASN